MRSILRALIVRILEWEARALLWRTRPFIVAITGSVGKTSSKDAIAHILSVRHSVRKSQKSYNSEIGVPLTIINSSSGGRSVLRWLGVLLKGAVFVISPGQYPSVLVLEVGADHPGDIQRITRWLTPHVTVLTKFAAVPSHLAFFSSREQLFQEKATLARALPSDGTVVFNRDDEDIVRMADAFDGERVSFGWHTTAHVYASHAHVTQDDRTAYPNGVTFRANIGTRTVPTAIHGVIGLHVIEPALAGLAVGHAMGLHLVEMSESLRTYQPNPGRMRVVEGLKNSVIIDDSYNSSPIAAHHALETLSGLRVNGRRIAVLGDMKELGAATEEAHVSLGRAAADVCDLIYTVGEYGAYIERGVEEAGADRGIVYRYEKSQQAGEDLEHLITAGDMILVKGSQSVRCERVVKEIMAHPERADTLLVRQEKGWQDI